MKRKLIFVRDFPLPRIQTGAPLGNSYLGILAWGEKNILNLTVGSDALWDHRGGMPWTPKQNLKDIVQALRDQDEERLKSIFRAKKIIKNAPDRGLRPTVLPIGRVRVTLTSCCILQRYELFMDTGLLKIFYTKKDKEYAAELLLGRTDLSVFVFQCDDVEKTELLSSWDIAREKKAVPPLKTRVIEPPVVKKNCFIQSLPEDPAFGCILHPDKEGFSFRYGRGKDVKAAEKVLKKPIPAFSELSAENKKFWKEFWKGVPSISLDDPEVEEIYWFGIYKFGSMTDPSGVPAGLQGPWIEDDRLPPWSADYHFNINAQMCYWPALRSGKATNLKRIFDMIFSWEKQLKTNARYFVGIPDGIMLPHAVDDRCTCMGGFWTGTIDHACAAWMGLMMFDYCRWTDDKNYLKEKVYPFLRGVMKVFQAMMEMKKDGTLSLPVSISPEYRGSLMTAWGSNSSFQLAAIHRLAGDLITSANLLGEAPDPDWQTIQEKLPEASIEGGEIALWDGLTLECSHRHHSHLGGIVPFGTIDPDDPRWATVLEKSYFRWVHKGMGEWDGWAIPWASMLHTHLGFPDAGLMMMHWWKNGFTNESMGSLIDSFTKGFTVYGDMERGEVMQMDGAMGMTAAIQEMFVLESAGVWHFFRGIPNRIKNATFQKMVLPAGFLADGVLHRREEKMSITLHCGSGVLTIKLPEEYVWTRNSKPVKSGILSCSGKKGEKLVFDGTFSCFRRRRKNSDEIEEFLMK